MNGSIYTGTSGILTYQNSLAIESNNAANASTLGFKSDTVSFNDLMYQNDIGRGVRSNESVKNFSQGSLNPSNSEYDFAISGPGFFTLQDPINPEKTYYTRTGQFSSNKDNELINSTGLLIMGVAPTVSGEIISSEYENNITSTSINTATSTYTLNTYTTDYRVKSKEIEAVLNNITAIEAVNNGTATQEQLKLIEQNPSLLTNYDKYSVQVNDLRNTQSGTNYKSINTMIDDINEVILQYSNALKSLSINPIEGEMATKSEYSVTFPLQANSNNDYTLELLVNGIKVQENFDTSVEKTLKNLSDKVSELNGITSEVDTTTGELKISSLISGATMNVTKAKTNDQNLAISKISEAGGSGQNLVDALYVDLESLLAKVGGSAASNKSEIVNSTTGEVALVPIILDLNSLGLSSTLYEKLINADSTDVASYPNIESENGNLYLRDGDARFLVGQLLPVNFVNPGALNPEGDNVYSKSVYQKEPIYVENTASVMGRFLENSNVNLSDTLVNLMVWQKAFEANSKTITTSDELLKTALALKNK